MMILREISICVIHESTVSNESPEVVHNTCLNDLFKNQTDFRIRMSFISRYVYTYNEFVFVTEANAVQQNDRDRTKNTNKKNKKEQVNKE